MPTTGERFERAVAIMSRLRAPGGCPWDREQTFDSIKPYTLEETYEVFEAIDNRDWRELPGELGDLLLQVLFYSEMAQEADLFSIDDVLERLSDKLVTRHPHVFGNVKAETSKDVLRNWEALKAEEKKARGEEAAPKSILASVPAAMPALLEAGKLSSKAAKTGFDWPDVEGVLDKLCEETEELRAALANAQPQPGRMDRGADGSSGTGIPQEREHLEEELGDMLFTIVNIARLLSLDPESALKKTNRKFRARFSYIEQQLEKRGQKPQDASLEELESLWQEGKQQENTHK